MGILFTAEVGKLLTRLLGNYLTATLGKVLDIYNPSPEGNLKGYPLERQYPQWDSQSLLKAYLFKLNLT